MLSAVQVFRLLAIALLALLFIEVLRERQRGIIARATLAWFLTLLCYLSFPALTGWPGSPFPLWAHLLLAGRNAVPFTFWLLSKAYFDDEFRPRPVHGLVGLGQVGFFHVSFLVLVEGLPYRAGSPAEEDFWALMPRGFALLVVVHALLGVYVGSRADLVAARLRLRRLVLLVSGSYILLVLLGEVFLHRAVDVRLAELANSAAIFVLVLVFSARLLRLEPELLRGPRPAQEQPEDQELREKLLGLLENEQAFREEGLTIGALADRLGEQEYRVRRVINGQLGFRNFNAFLHDYRIREARRILRDPEQAHLNVAEVAYALGYKSLGPFNKAFKELTGQTPTEWRRRSGD